MVEYRSAEDQAHRLPALVADLVRRQVALIVGNTPSALAAKSAATTVPIVFVTGGDPVMQGFVASLNRPETRQRRRHILENSAPDSPVERVRMTPFLDVSATLLARADEVIQ